MPNQSDITLSRLDDPDAYATAESKGELVHVKVKAVATFPSDEPAHHPHVKDKKQFKKMVKRHISETGVDFVMNSPDLDSWYAWLLCGVGILVKILVAGQTYSFSLYFGEFLDEFGEGKSNTSWIGSIGLFSLLLSGAVVGKLDNHFGLRITAFAGGLLFAAGLFLSSWVNELWYLYVTYGLLMGLGNTMCDVSFLTAIGIFFEKKKALAVGVYMSGGGIGTIVLPILLRHLIAEYGWRGSLRIQSAMAVGVLCLSALLLRHPRFPSNFDFKNASRSAFHQHHRSFRELLGDKYVRLYMVALALYAFGYFLPFTYLVRPHHDAAPIKLTRCSSRWPQRTSV